MTSAEREQQERRQVLQNDRLVREQRSTYLAFAESNADQEAQGRWAKQNKAEVSGVPTYPRLPSGLWSGDPVPSDPFTDQLGFSVNEMQPVGEPHEIAQSIHELAAGVSPPPVAEEAAGLSFPSERAPSNREPAPPLSVGDTLHPRSGVASQSSTDPLRSAGEGVSRTVMGQDGSSGSPPTSTKGR